MFAPEQTAAAYERLFAEIGAANVETCLRVNV